MIECNSPFTVPQEGLNVNKWIKRRLRGLLLSLSSLGSGSRDLLVEQEGGGALAAVDAVKVVGHEGSGAAVGALLTQALHLAGVLDLEEWQGDGAGSRA